MKKLARDLKPGDILPENTAYSRRIVLAVTPSGTFPGHAQVRIYGTVSGAIDTMTTGLDMEIEVEAPTLTPAQVHADELLGLLRRAIGLIPGGKWDAEVSALLARIDPPAPPTLSEALEALLTLADGAQQVGTGDWDASQSKARALLDRARAAGVL